MSKKEAKTPVSLATMLGTGDTFEAKDKTYKVKPIKLKDVEEFMADNLSIGSQLFNVSNKDSKTKIDKWLNGYAVDSKDEPMSLDKAMNDEWDIVDLKNFIKKLCDLSG
jgi:hypothetical protein